jgi:hypothetical protein
MTDERMALQSLLEKTLDADFLRRMGAAQDHGLLGVGMARELELDAFLDHAPAIRASELGASRNTAGFSACAERSDFVLWRN